MNKRKPRPESVRLAISATLSGRKLSPEHRAAIREGNKRAWERLSRKEKKARVNSVGAHIKRDRAAWKAEQTSLDFRDWLLNERPLNANRANFLYPEGFWVFKHIDPFNGQLLHVGISPTEEGMREYQPSVFRRNRRRASSNRRASR
jgi:hypothetical protein